MKAIAFCLLLTSIALNSCIKPLCNCEPPASDIFECKIVNSQGQNLVFGAAAVFQVDSIKVLQNPTDLSVQNAVVTKVHRDSTSLEFQFTRQTGKSFIYYNRQTPTDTLEVDWLKQNGKCCGDPYTISVIQQARFNGATILPQNRVYTLVKR